MVATLTSYEKKLSRRQSQIEQIQKPPNGGWGWLIVIGGVITLMNWAGIQRCYSVFYLTFMDEYQADLSEVAWINGLFSVALAISGLITPAIANKFGYRFAVMTCGVVVCVSMFLASFSGQLWQLQILAGFFVGMGFGPAVLSIFTVAVRYFTTRRNMAMQILCSGSALGAFAFCPIYQLLINSYGWRGAFKVISGFFLQVAVAGAVLFPLILKEDFSSENLLLDENYNHDKKKVEVIVSNEDSLIQLETGVENENSKPPSFRKNLETFCIKHNLQLLVSYPFYLYTIGWLTFAVSYFCSLTYLIPYGREVVGLTDIEASTLISAVMGGEALSRLSYALVFDRLIVQTRICFAAIIITVMGIVFFCLPFLQNYASLLIGCIIIGLTGGGMDGVFSIFIVDVFGLNQYSSVFAYCNAITHFLSMASTVLIGKVVDSTSNFTLVFYIGGLFAVLSSFLTFLMRRHLIQNNSNR